MSFDKNLFSQQIPTSFSSIKEILHSFGFKAVLVGGAVRDFILTGRSGTDWDLEIYHSQLAFSVDLWKSFGVELKKLGKCTYHPYSVIKLEIEDYSFEFSPPRKEIYHDYLSQNGHKNFDVEFDFKLPFQMAVLRRDFTINAIALDLENLLILDPLNGCNDLQNSQLEICSEDFSRDPVRFLRAIRFMVKFDFKLSKKLQSRLSQMSSLNFSSVYLWAEMMKSSHPWEFYEKLLFYFPHEKMDLLPLVFENDEQKNKVKKILLDSHLQFSWIVAQEMISISSDKWVEYFHFSTQDQKRIKAWIQGIFWLQKKDLGFFQRDFDELKNDPDFEKLFQWFYSTKQLIKKFHSYPFHDFFKSNVPDWGKLFQVEMPAPDLILEPVDRSKYQLWSLCQRL